jgi:thiol-disulfide isomerase/thioredoxin
VSLQLAAASVLVVVSAAARRQDGPPPPARPQQRETPSRSNATDVLAAVAAGWRETPALAVDVVVKTRIQELEVAQKAKLLLARPDRARLELSGAGQDALLVYDGSSSWHYLKAKRVYLKTKQLGFSKLEQYGAGPVATLFFEKGVGPLASYLADATVTSERLGDDDCQVVAWTVGNEESRVWICGDRLRRFRATRSINGQTFEQTIEYKPFDLAPTVAADAFTFTPPERARPMDPEGEDALLEVGSKCPDFVATTLDGRTMKPSDLAGAPFLVDFWFYGCATCREELPRLQKLNEEFGPRGVRMLAVNYGDPAATIATYFEKSKLTLTPLQQKDDEVTRAFGVQSYPTTYLVDRDGKIAWHAVGFDEASLRAALEKLAPAK